MKFGTNQSNKQWKIYMTRELVVNELGVIGPLMNFLRDTEPLSNESLKLAADKILKEGLSQWFEDLPEHLAERFPFEYLYIDDGKLVEIEIQEYNV